MYDCVHRVTESPSFPVPIPGLKGVVTAQVVNTDYAVGPAMFLFTFQPGAWIPAHRHATATETFLLLDGEFIDAGTTHAPGTFFVVKPGTVHGPHTTTRGCRLLVIQTKAVDPSDFEIVGATEP